MIYYVTSNTDWQNALQQGFYEHRSLTVEGFIHASKKEQVKGVLDRYYKNQADLLLLHIDETKLTAVLKYELVPSVSEEFPHIHGALNLDAVVATTTI